MAHPDASDYVARISGAFGLGDMRAVSELTSEARARFPLHPHLAVLQFRSLVEQGEQDKAFSVLKTLPDDIRFGAALLSAAEVLQKSGEVAALERLIDGVPTSYAKTRQVEFSRLQYLELSKGVDAAIEWARRLSTASPDDPGWMLEHTRLLQKANRYRQVIRILKGWSATPLNAAGVTRLANAYLAMSEPAQARDILETYAALTQENPGLAVLELRAVMADAVSDGGLALAEKAVKRWPDHVQIRALYWQCLRCSGALSAAISDCLAFAEENVERPQAIAQVARFLAAHDDPGRAIDLLEKAQSRNPHSHALSELRAELTFQSRDAGQAAEQLHQFFAQRPWTDTALHLLARIEDALGHSHTAFDRLVRRVQQKAPAPSVLSLEAAAIAMRMGRFDEAEALLAELSTLSPSQKARQAMIRAHIALEQGDDSQALEQARVATEAAPGLGEAWSLLSQIQLMSGARQEAVASQSKSIAQRQKTAEPQQAAPKFMNTMQGQIINEYRLLAELPDLALMSPKRDQSLSARQLRQRLQKHRDSTPLAMGVFNALRRDGRIGTTTAPAFPAGKTPRIPCQVFQFWDSAEPPAQIAEIMSANQKLNPDWSFRLFSEKTALAYLRDREETRAVRAFRSAPHAAAKADIFRLALLWHEGGVYMDADDRCLVPLSELIDRRLRHVFYLEPQRTIGNNFFAAEPHSPILRAALDDAVRAFSGPTGETIWLATGPGAMTRALALLGTTEDGGLQEGIWVMPMHRLRQSIAIHLRLPYKTSSAHWLKDMTQRPG